MDTAETPSSKADPVGRLPAACSAQTTRPSVPAHGEMASQEQIREGVEAVEEAGGGGTDMGGNPTGEADTGRPGQGGTGQGTNNSTVGDPETTGAAARERTPRQRRHLSTHVRAPVPVATPDAVGPEGAGGEPPGSGRPSDGPPDPS